MASITNILKIPDLRKRVFFTIIALIIFRVGAHITTPGINPEALAEMMDNLSQNLNNVLGYIDLFSGGAFKNFTIFALGVMPYISASIILNLLTTVIPHLESLSKEGEMGRRKIQQYTRYLTVLICIIQSSAISRWIGSHAEVITVDNTWFFTFIVVVTITTGTVFLMWLGEQITERGIGNGISLLIFAGIAARIPTEFIKTFENVRNEQFNPVSFLLLLIIFGIIIFFVVFEQQGERRIPIQFARKVVGKKMYGAQNTYLPLKVNPSGVIPIIFASAIVMVPGQIASMLGDKFPTVRTIAAHLSPQHVPYLIVYGILVVAFAYFYTTVQFNPVEMAANLKKQGGFIPGKRPGIHTQEYIQKVLIRITLSGSLFLAFIAVFPDVLLMTNLFSGISPGFAYLMGGTSLLILVAVDLDTMKQIESQLVMREYDGFMSRKKRRRVGRR